MHSFEPVSPVNHRLAPALQISMVPNISVSDSPGCLACQWFLPESPQFFVQFTEARLDRVRDIIGVSTSMQGQIIARAHNLLDCWDKEYGGSKSFITFKLD